MTAPYEFEEQLFLQFNTEEIDLLDSAITKIKNSNAKILCQDTDGDGLTDLYEGSNSRTSQTEKDILNY